MKKALLILAIVIAVTAGIVLAVKFFDVSKKEIIRAPEGGVEYMSYNKLFSLKRPSNFRVLFDTEYAERSQRPILFDFVKMRGEDDQGRT